MDEALQELTNLLNAAVPSMYAGIRRFRLDRDRRGEVYEDGPMKGLERGFENYAQGAVFYDARVLIVRMGAPIVELASIDELESYVREARMRIRWQDPICVECGIMLSHKETIARRCEGCYAVQPERPYKETRPAEKAVSDG